jgi:predicted CXXCH cytochrome family protein
VGTHATFPCGTTCHTPAFTAKAGQSAGYAVTSDRKQICYQCHAANYNATSFINHASYNMGTYCNSCHYSDSFKTHNRASHASYHKYITTACETCHATRYPSSHSNSRTSGCAGCHEYSNGSWGFKAGAHIYTSGCSGCHAGKKPSSHSKYNTDSCEKCHSYPSWSGASFNHAGASGCATCHSGHYSPYSCEGCHTREKSWSFRHGSVSSENCSACHSGGSEGGGGHGGGDD